MDVREGLVTRMGSIEGVDEVEATGEVNMVEGGA